MQTPLLLEFFTKKCSSCKIIKNRSDFNLSASSKYGVQNLCKKCKKVVRDKNKERLKQQMREWYIANRDKVLEYQSIYRAENKEDIKKRQKEIRTKNYQKLKISKRKYIDDNKEKVREYFKEYRTREKCKLTKRNCHLRRRSAVKNSDIDSAYLKEILNSSKLCYWCSATLKDDKHIDHYIPLSKGGGHTKDNIVVSCPKCNQAKSAKDPYEFANSLGRLL